MIDKAFLVAALSAVALPPAKYDYPAEEMNVVHVPVERINRACGHPREVVVGCAFPLPQGCTIILPRPSDVGRADYERVYRHEQAHCNGWPMHHPGGPFLAR